MKSKKISIFLKQDLIHYKLIKIQQTKFPHPIVVKKCQHMSFEKQKKLIKLEKNFKILKIILIKKW